MRKTPFVIGQYYHIYNRGVDKRRIFEDKYDMLRFFQSMELFNTKEPIGSIYEQAFGNDELKLGRSTSKLVNFVAYCLNPNHFHFILEELTDGGISEFMRRLGGYTKYFNEKHKRSGVLFQGRFKSVHVESNEYLLHLSAYVNLNYLIHAYDADEIGLVKSSWEEYIVGSEDSFCQKNIILEQFSSINKYQLFAKSSVEETIRGRDLKEFE